MKKFARKCDATGRGMNTGWVFRDGEYYASTEESALAYAKRLGCESIEEAYNDELCYYTEWEEIDEDEWFTELGECVNGDELRLVMLSLSHVLTEVTEDIVIAYYLHKDLTGAEVADLFGDWADFQIIEFVDGLIDTMKKVQQ
jgi:hypothetical protein